MFVPSLYRPVRRPKTIQFGILSPEEIKAISVCKVEYPETYEEGSQRPVSRGGAKLGAPGGDGRADWDFSTRRNLVDSRTRDWERSTATSSARPAVRGWQSVPVTLGTSNSVAPSSTSVRVPAAPVRQSH